MNCRYCDEAGKPGREWTQGEVLSEIERLDAFQGPHTFVSLTGGEPLLYVRFLVPLMKALKRAGYRIYLETSGVLWEPLKAVIGFCDCVAMDIKPASVTGDQNYDAEHGRFLSIAAAKPVFVKFSVSEEINPAEFDSEIDMIRRISPDIPVVLQAVCAGNPGVNAALEQLLCRLRDSAKKKIKDLRILPRLHQQFQLR